MEYDDRFVEQLVLRYNITSDDMISVYKEMYKTYIDNLIKQGIHTYAISPPKKEGGMWNTYVYDEKRPNHRRQIQGRSEKGFYKSVYEWYNPHGERYKNITIEQIIEEVIDYKRNVLLNDEETIKRFLHTYNKYYKNSEFSRKAIVKTTMNDCEDFYNSFIENGMKEKEFNRLIGVGNSVYDYSRRRIRIISESPLENAHINRKLLIKGLDETDEDRVYFPDEKEKLFSVIKIHLNEPDYDRKADLYAILLVFKLGLRIGEVAALCYSDISIRFNYLYICKMEKSHLHTVVDHTKTYEIRKMPLSEYEFKIFDLVKKCTEDYKPDGDYIFINSDGRRRSRGFDNTLRDLCDEAGIPQKSFHDIRRTVASEMHEKGRSMEEIRKYLGHKDIKTTQGYIYNLKRNDAYGEAVHNSLKGNEIDL